MEFGTITIAAETRSLDQAEEAWITQQINRRKRDGLDVCVAISLKATDVDLRFATPSCGGSGGGARPLSARERRIVELWVSHRLDTSEFSGGEVVSFLKQLRRLL